MTHSGYASVIVLMVGISSAIPQTKPAPYIKFNWGCSGQKAYPKKTLEKIVRSTMKEEGFEDFGTWGDRAVALDLNGDRKAEYFVPLDCGGTGNCVWGLFASAPARKLAMITGKDIYVQKVQGRWAELVVYSHFSAVEGSLATYRMSKGKYVEVSPHVPISLAEADPNSQSGSSSHFPKALESAKRICQSVE